ncbi:MAG: leucine-rich repeat protein [Muribaculaceae bacterium]|nr:leucine-rich repeat protein [Muribaculaceae bacterium]
MNRTIHLIGFILLCIISTNATNFSYNGLNYSVWTTNTVAIMPADDGTTYSGLTTSNFSEMVEYNGKTYTVAGVYDQAFNKASFNGRITLPATVTTIGQFAFYAATGEGVTLGENVTSIAENAFAGNKFSQGVFVNASNPSYANLTDSDGTNSNGVLVTKDKKTLLTFPGGKKQSSWSGTTALSSYTIPSFITEIGDFAFYRNEGLSTITIPNGVTRIGRAAFLECLDYSSITIPASVTKLDDAAFQGCVNCTRLTFNTRQLTVIPSNAFFCLVSLKSVTIPEGVKTIGENAFASCEQLSAINLSSTVEDIGQSCFMGDPITSIDLKNVKTLAYMSFARCESLTTITGGSQLDFIDNAAFVRCDALTNVNFPEGVKTFFGNTFFRCASLRSLTLPTSLQCIGVNPVTGCEQLSTLNVASGSPYFKIIDGALYATRGSIDVGVAPNANGDPDQPTALVSVPSAIAKKTLDVPEGVTTLGKQSVREVELTRISLPSTLTAIRDFAFGDVYTLKKVTCKALTPPSGGDIENGNYIFEEDVFNDATLFVPQEAIDTYRNHIIWGRFKNIQDLESDVVPVDSTTKFPYVVENNYTFYFRVIADDEVEYIAPSDYDPDLGPYSGVYRYETPETVEYNDKTYRVTTVGEGAFKDATIHGGNDYTNLIWLNNVQTIKANAFSGWHINWLGLNSITDVDPTAFRGNKINRMTIFGGDFGYSPDNNGNYNGSAMSGDIYKMVDGKKVLWGWGGDRRTNAWMNGNMSITTAWTFNYDEIGAYALADNENLTSVTIEGASKIGQEALAGMTALQTLVLPAQLTEIGTDAFKGVTTLTSLTVNAVNPPAGGVFEDAVYEALKDKLVVPAGSENAYKADRNWGKFYTGYTPPAVTGDLNGDGVVDVADVNICINIILELNNNPDVKALADLNGDGVVDISDVNAIINIILQ